MAVRGLLIILMGCLGCSGDHTWLSDADVAGKVEISLRREGAIEVDSVWIILTEPDDTTSSYEVDITGSDSASINFGALPPGVYSVRFSAVTRQGDPCSGSADFEIEPDVITQVEVQVLCEVD
jgi:hypothetical protein